MKSILFAVFCFPFLAQAQVVENEQVISFQLNSKSESDEIYKNLNVQETWVKAPTGGMYTAKLYQDPTGAFSIRCDQVNELKRTCNLVIKKTVQDSNIQYIDDSKFFAVVLLDLNEIHKLWNVIALPEMDHGTFVFKVLSNDSSDFSLMCLKKKESEDKSMCQAQILR